MKSAEQITAKIYNQLVRECGDGGKGKHHETVSTEVKKLVKERDAAVELASSLLRCVQVLWEIRSDE